jgi:hypothetical protein
MFTWVLRMDLSDMGQRIIAGAWMRLTIVSVISGVEHFGFHYQRMNYN